MYLFLKERNNEYIWTLGIIVVQARASNKGKEFRIFLKVFFFLPSHSRHTTCLFLWKRKHGTTSIRTLFGNGPLNIVSSYNVSVLGFN
jgi:hypothetical protein